MAMFKFSAIRNLKGKTYFIDCCDLGDVELLLTVRIMPYELMVFEAGTHREDAQEMVYGEGNNSIVKDREFMRSVNWSDLYVERYSTPKQALEGFKRVIADLGDYIPVEEDDKRE